MAKVLHKSVLLDEAVGFLDVKRGETYIDATLGAGGHTKKILERGGKVLGIDIDPKSITRVSRDFSVSIKEEEGILSGKTPSLTITQGNFANLESIARKFGVWETPGIVFDLGFSSIQLEEGGKGLSFQKDEPLDMRLDPRLGVTAADLVNGLNQRQLYELFSRYGEEPNSRHLARAISIARIKKKIETSGELARVIEKSSNRQGKIHPATRVFLALRIAVNDELVNLEKGLTQAASLLKSKGRLVVISFHSLEDRIVKNFFRGRGDLRILTARPIVPSREEVLDNPRSRSARLRVAEKN